MPVVHHTCTDFDSFKSLSSSFPRKSDVGVVILFTGAVDKDTGKSWCPDCAGAQPVIDDYLKGIETEKEIHFIQVEIEKEIWKDSRCLFRTEPKLQLKFVPTLMKLNGPERLEEAELMNKSLLQLFFQSCLENN